MSQINAVDFLKKGSLFIHSNYPSTPHVYEIVKVKDSTVTIDWKSNAYKPIKYTIRDAVQMITEGLWIPITDRSQYDI